MDEALGSTRYLPRAFASRSTFLEYGEESSSEFQQRLARKMLRPLRPSDFQSRSSTTLKDVLKRLPDEGG